MVDGLMLTIRLSFNIFFLQIMCCACHLLKYFSRSDCVCRSHLCPCQLTWDGGASASVFRLAVLGRYAHILPIWVGGGSEIVAAMCISIPVTGRKHMFRIVDL
jgi:hypothetical protein